MDSMTGEIDLNEIAVSVASLEDREELISRIMKIVLNCGRKLDFTRTHLNQLSVDKLRHILFAALVTKTK